MENKMLTEGAAISAAEIIETNVVLDRVRVRVSEYITGTLLHSLTVNMVNEFADRLGMELVGEVLSEKLEEREKTVTFYQPKNWWEMLKEQYFKGWLLKKFPVKQKAVIRKVVFRKYATYPKLPEVHKNCGPVVYRSMIYEKN